MVDTAAAPGALYFYTVTAVNAAGESPPSNLTAMIGAKSQAGQWQAMFDPTPAQEPGNYLGGIRLHPGLNRLSAVARRAGIGG